MQLVYFALIAGLVALVFAAYLFAVEMRESSGNEKMRELDRAIYEDTMTCLERRYKILIPFTVGIFLVLRFFIDGMIAISFLKGAVCSAIAGYVGMTVTAKSKISTTKAVGTSLNTSPGLSLRTNAAMGMLVSGFGLLGASVLYTVDSSLEIFSSWAFCVGAIVFSNRIGGGIYTKVANIGVSHVGKVAAGVPKDEARNPAAIDGNVGANVMSYSITTIAAMKIGNSIFGANGAFFPLLIGAAGIAATIISTFFVRTGENGNSRMALYFGLWGANLITAILACFLADYSFGAQGWGIFIAIICGLVINVLCGMLTEYNGSKGLKGTALLMVAFALIIGVAYSFAQIYGIAMAAMGMLCTAGIVGKSWGQA